MRRSILVSAGLVALAGLASGGWYVHYNSYEEIAKRDVAKDLKDPDSAKFSEVERCEDQGIVLFVAGYVNSRNTYGAMAGKEFFLTRFVGRDPFSDISETSDKSNYAFKFQEAKIQGDVDAKRSCAEDLAATEKLMADDIKARERVEEEAEALMEADESTAIDPAERELTRAVDWAQRAAEVASKD